ncbi:PDZ domain-containing protein [Lysinibacillus macroides]|uniref:Peptidase S41 n=1 Tax=Lysinibacillus macroides TaxID=33935 RepID=A0A0M9DL21_9BACI|nr:S41 family peptidase [Lysinibacillus macroides]KOY82342.1 peptidase S41 [Lysinibacillus macroides]QPR66618.1 PDZ domain-containing protein [Lysinibacillus macroides]
MKKLIWSFVFMLSFLLLPFTATHAASHEQQLVKEIKEVINNTYVGTIDGDLKSATSISEIISMLDPYSTYFTEQEFEDYMNSINLATIGIGVVIEEHKDGILIKDVIEGSGAFEADVQAGDIIIAINGKSIAGSSIQEASSLLLGNEDTQVKITLKHNDETTSTKTITRKKFALPNVQSELLFGNVGYIAMTSFSEDGAQLVKKALLDLRQRGATSFILDLQNNGGGYVTTAEELTGLFPSAKVAYLLEEAHGIYTIPAAHQDAKFPTNTRILVNRYSASASEMLAASLQDQKAAILYGETTYGKGAMQGFYTLQDGSYLKLTVGKFTGPDQKTIHEVGVKPNIQTTAAPIFQAHFDALKEQYSKYKKLSNVKNSTNTQKLTIKIPASLTSQIAKGHIQLVALGANEVSASAKVTGNSIIVTPTNPLSLDQEYMLFIHPNAHSKVQKGYYQHIKITS